MARARGARSGAARPARARLQGGGAPPRRAAPPRLAPRHAPPGSPRALGAVRAGPPLPRAGGKRPRPKLLARAGEDAEEAEVAEAEEGGGARERRPREGRLRGAKQEGRLRGGPPPPAAQPPCCCCCCRRRRAGSASRGGLRSAVAATLAATAAGGRSLQPHSMSLGSAAAPAAAATAAAAAGVEAAAPHRAPRARRAPSCLPGSSSSPGRPHPAPGFRPRPSPRPSPAPDARRHLFAAPARDSPACGSPQRRSGGAGSLNPSAASRPGRGGGCARHRRGDRRIPEFHRPQGVGAPTPCPLRRAAPPSASLSPRGVASPARRKERGPAPASFSPLSPAPALLCSCAGPPLGVRAPLAPRVVCGPGDWGHCFKTGSQSREICSHRIQVWVPTQS